MRAWLRMLMRGCIRMDVHMCMAAKVNGWVSE